MTTTPGDLDIRGYKLSNVYGRVPASVRDEIVGMWLAAEVLLPDEAKRRVDEVVYTIRHPSGVLAGVSTVYVGDVAGVVAPYYFFRMFVRPADRGVWGLPGGTLRATVALLRDLAHPRKPRGLVAIVENPRLMSRGPVARMRRYGFTLVGRDRQGHDVWCIHFDGTVPVPPAGLLTPVDPVA